MPMKVDHGGVQKSGDVPEDPENDQKEVRAIGIDLGSTHSRVAVWQGGHVEIIPDDEGKTVLPNYIFFTDTVQVGSLALDQSPRSPHNTIFDLKRLIGRSWDDPHVQGDLNTWGFTVTNTSSSLEIEVDHNGEHQRFTPQELQSLILRKLKHTAEDFLGTEVHDAVITVPAYFNDSQRQATKEAGALAGLNVLRMINDPTASAITCGLRSRFNINDNIMIFDLGGGTCDVSIISVRKDCLFEVRAIAGDTHLGGQDFDTRLYDYLLEHFERKHKVSIPSKCRGLRRLKLAAEEAKHTLSSNTEATVSINSLFNDLDLHVRVSRARFVALCIDLFMDTIKLVDKASADARIDKREISEVVLVGGSTRIPKIRALLQEHFPKGKLTIFPNPEEIVVQGAAIQAALLSGFTQDQLGKLLVVDVTPLSLGIETTGGLMSVLVKRNTGIPCRESRIFTTTSDDQDRVSIRVFEGERVLTRDNHLLGKFQLSGIPSARRGIPKIFVCFELNANGILSVTGEVQNGIQRKLRISRGTEGVQSRRRSGSVNHIVRDAWTVLRDDHKEVKRRNSKRRLETFVNYLRENLEHLEDLNGFKNLKRRRQDLEGIDQLCQAVDKWLIGDQYEETAVYEPELEQCYPIVSRCEGKQLRTE